MHVNVRSGAEGVRSRSLDIKQGFRTVFRREGKHTIAVAVIVKTIDTKCLRSTKRVTV